jgi:hypothetical protein
MTTFNLKIAAENEAMSSWANVAEALRRLADEIEGENPDESLCVTEGLARGPIFDENGNQVGSWSVTP